MSLAALAVDALVGLVTGGTGGYLLYILSRDGARAFGPRSRGLTVGLAAVGLLLYAVSLAEDALAGQVAGGALFMPAVAVLFLWYAARSRRSVAPSLSPSPPPESKPESRSESESESDSEAGPER
jgi:hypothetical protein